MAKKRVFLNGYASATITVETDKTDPGEIYEQAMNEGVPSLCAQCSGWGSSYSLEVGDEWEPEADKDGVVVVCDVKD
ncbi:hypothetical protein ACGF5F_29705 [Streptomyces sp. NPDC047821]|uniref:hypothetical protein n=1 Tax=Streptomyces sp. NPDC047821 TaxID=3365488 RepID=UPI00371487A1